MELNEVMRKYKAAVAQLSVDQITLQDQTAQLMTLEHEKSTLKEQVRPVFWAFHLAPWHLIVSFLFILFIYLYIFERLNPQVAELSARLECLEIDTKSVHTQKRMELKVKELESRVELEQTSKSRLEVNNVVIEQTAGTIFDISKPNLTRFLFPSLNTKFLFVFSLFFRHLDASVTTEGDVG